MSILVIELTDEQRDNLEDELLKITYPDNNYTKYIKDMKIILEKFKHIFKEAIENSNLSYNFPNSFGLVKFKNLPIDKDISMQPLNYKDYKRIDKNSYLSENILILIGLIYGEPYSMFHEGKGLINNLIPAENTKKDYTGMGSSVELGFHIENSALRYITRKNCSPKALLLTGVRQQISPPHNTY